MEVHIELAEADAVTKNNDRRMIAKTPAQLTLPIGSLGPNY